MTPAGWYDDPLIPGGKRYWDGAQWTDHAQAPPVNPQGPVGQPGAPAPFAAPMDGPPPFAATPSGLPPGPGGQAVYTGTGINDIGDWIKRSFSMVFQRFGPLTVFFLPQLLIGAIGYLLLDQAVRGAAITDDGDFLGFDGGLIMASSLVFLLSFVVGLAALLAGHHSLYAGHVGQKPTIGQSFSAGLRSLPRYIGVLILLYIVMILVFAVLAGVGIGLGAALGDSGDALLGIMFVVAYLAFIVLSLWLSVKLAFITVGAAVMPRGTSVIKTSWDVSTGYFWGILGRQLLLSLLVSMLGMVVYFITYIAVIALVFTQFGFTEEGTITVDGQDIETLSIFEFSDFLPNPILVIVTFAILGYLVYVIQSVIYSGTAALYADLNGPNIFGHGRRQQASDW